MRPLRAVPRMIALGVVALVGCGSTAALKPVAPAKGQVLLDGKPLAGVLVVFHPVGDALPNALDPRAVAATDGTFVVSTHNANDGAPPGKYAVTVHDIRPGAEAGGPPIAPGATRLPPRYEDQGRSGLEVEIHAGPNDIPPFRLAR